MMFCRKVKTSFRQDGALTPPSVFAWWAPTKTPCQHEADRGNEEEEIDFMDYSPSALIQPWLGW